MYDVLSLVFLFSKFTKYVYTLSFLAHLKSDEYIFTLNKYFSSNNLAVGYVLFIITSFEDRDMADEEQLLGEDDSFDNDALLNGQDDLDGNDILNGENGGPKSAEVS